jgi:hypothetical protein
MSASKVSTSVSWSQAPAAELHVHGALASKKVSTPGPPV